MWGGDVAKFAGDALLCVWKVDEKSKYASVNMIEAKRQGNIL